MRYLFTVPRSVRKLCSPWSSMYCTQGKSSIQQYPKRSMISTLKLVILTILSFVSSLALYVRPSLPPGKYDVESTWLSWALITVFCYIRRGMEARKPGYQPLQTESTSSLAFVEKRSRKLLEGAFPFLAVTAGMFSTAFAAKDFLVSGAQG